MLNFIDFEVFKEDWMCRIINPITTETTQVINDPDFLRKFYESHKDEIFVGYNVRGYDQFIFKAIILGLSPQKVNEWIIVKKRKGWEYSSAFRNVPLNIYDVMFGLNSLKKLEGFMGNDIRETTVDFNIDRKLTDDEIKEVMEYCTHDVEQLIEVFIKRKAEFDAQMSLVKTFNLPLSCIGKTQAQLAAIILNAKKVNHNDDWDIRLPDTLKLKKYQHIADWFMNKENHTLDSSLKTNICGVPHIIGLGGLHGAVNNVDIKCGKDEMLIMSDVAQLYPTLMIEYGLLSRGVTDYDKFKFILNESLRLKELKMKKEREPYKRICNITYGSMGDEYNPMYDPLHRTLVCVFGQVLIIMLLEWLEKRVSSFELIQSNTDGILFKIKEKDFGLVDDIIYHWEQQTRLKMEFDYYKRVIQKDVNNYIAITEDGGMKSKGAYVKKLSDLDYDLPIVNKAVTEYLVNGTPVEKTIYECDELIKFQKIVKISDKYAYAMKNCTFTKKGQWKYDGYKLNESTLRVYASSDPKDGGVFKMKANPEKIADTSEKCFIHNESVVGKKCPAKLDKSFYVAMANERINKFKGV